MRIEKIVSGDYLTPISIYLRLEGTNKVILESIPRNNEDSRYSIIACNPVSHIKFIDGNLIVDQKVVETPDPLAYLSQLTLKTDSPSSSVDYPFQAGAIGYIGYDMYAFYEKIKLENYDQLKIPDFYFMLYESFVVFDHKKEKVILVEDNLYSNRTKKEMEKSLEDVITNLKQICKQEYQNKDVKKLSFEANVSQNQFKDQVTKARELIRQGDMFQIVLSQRFEADIEANPFDYYRRLRLENPSSYLYYLDFSDFQILGSSPESLVATKDGVVTTNPIAGTIKRGRNRYEDKLLAEELKNNEKEQSEHKMLVDLGRNDLGRISEYGTVEVPLFMEVESYRYVMHLVSLVKGKLRRGLGSVDALISTLPAGTLSGAPKNRAFKRIYEFESVKRNFYGGAIGYISNNDNCDFAIAIRTMLVKDHKAYVQAGAGIVYDSDPQKEYEECLNKARLFTDLGD
ncbi:anthranilate synthase component I [Streptococcaceae bacterium ESL0687]|nr:anthranilate synthase component I [Streptococcaceae bacterium ESL0687]